MSRCLRPSLSVGLGVLATSLLVLAAPRLACAADPGGSITRAVPVQEAEIAALSIAINGAPEPGVAYVIRSPGGLLVDRGTLARLRFQFAESDVVQIDGRAYVPMKTLRGTRGSIDEPQQRLDLDVDPELLAATRVQFGLPAPELAQTPPWGGFLNYGLFGYTNVGSGASFNSDNVSAGFEAVVFGPYGTGTASFLVNSPTAADFSNERAVLLEAAWRWDDPARMRTLIVGDAITAPGWWGQAVRFGGVQYSSNFSLQPGFVTYPLLTVSGISTIPTAADIYSNNVRMGTQNVPAGPFSITNVPLLTGAGELQVVVNNAFGQQQVITQPYYLTTQLLKPGLSQFSLSAGSLRYNYGLRNVDYRGYVASGYYRYGINERLTAEGRAEASSDVQGAGAGADFVLGYLGVVSAGVAASHASDDVVGASGSGARVLLGFSRQASLASFAVRSTWASPNYREVGDSPILQTRTTSASFNVALPGQAGSIAIAYGHQRLRDTLPPEPNVPSQSGSLNIVSATYSVGLGRYGFLTFSASKASGLSNQTQVLALYSLPFGASPNAPADTTITLGAQRVRGDGQSDDFGTLDIQRPLPVGQGFGYYVHAQTNRNFTGGVSYYGNYGRYTLEGSSFDGSEAIRGSIAGGIGIIGGHVFIAPPIEQSFALVEVGDVAGARVLQENNFAGVTGRDGTLVLPRLPTYTPVNIALDPLSVPLDFTVNETQQRVVTLGRTGVLVKFDSQRERNALVRVQLPDGSPMPAGAAARVIGRGETMPFGLGGEVYLTNLGDSQQIEITYRGRSCELPIALAKDSPAVADLGPFVCALRDPGGAKP